MLEREKGGRLHFWSSASGRRLKTSREELAEAAAELGVAPASGLDPAGEVATEWVDGAAPPADGLLFSDLAPREASAGRFLGAQEWNTVATAGGDHLVPGCECRACLLTSPTLLRHLLSAREITAQHLLAWHNLHQMQVASKLTEVS